MKVIGLSLVLHYEQLTLGPDSKPGWRAPGFGLWSHRPGRVTLKVPAVHIPLPLRGREGTRVAVRRGGGASLRRARRQVEQLLKRTAVVIVVHGGLQGGAAEKRQGTGTSQRCRVVKIADGGDSWGPRL